MCERERGKGGGERGSERKTEREKDSQQAYGGFTSEIVPHWKVKDALQVINEWKQFLNIGAAYYTPIHASDRDAGTQKMPKNQLNQQEIGDFAHMQRMCF